jgi:hypothetical protein
MKHLLIFFALFFISLNLFPQDIKPPNAVDNKVYEAMTGSWEGESNMMGMMKSKEELKIYWALGHQFIFVELSAAGIDNPKMTYSGLGVFGVDEKGNAKVWWFDNWGASAISTGDGTFEGDNKLIIKNGNAMFSETRTFEVKGNEMIMSAKGKMTMNGQEMPYDETTTYKRK